MFDVPPLKWSESHGVEDGHQGMGALYFSLPYMLRARHCVCLGSGAGFVPLLMLSAQRKLISEGLLEKTDVTLIDADIGIWGLPVYRSGTEIDPDLVLIKKLTSEAVHEVGSIHYLHVDADHTYAGVWADLKAYLPKMEGDWAITVHDTHNINNLHQPIGALEAATKFARRHGFSIMNFKVGCGTALIRKKDG